MMTPKERVLNCLERKPFDRIPIKHVAEPEVDAMLMEYFKVTTPLEVLEKVGDDFRSVTPGYTGPPLKIFKEDVTPEIRDAAFLWEMGIWGETYDRVSFGDGTYNEASFLPYKGLTEVKQLDDLEWPSADWYDYSTIKDQCREFSDYADIGGWGGTLDLINGTARCRGVEQVLLDIGRRDPVYLEIIQRRTDFHYEKTKRVLEAADGLIDIVHCGDDFGAQNGLLISPKHYDEIFAPHYRRFTEMVHKYGAKVMMHHCGSARGLIPNYVRDGIDILDVIQVSAAGMAIEGLKKDFGDSISFCGSVCVQSTLPKGSVADVKKEVELRKELFKEGGLFLGPTHALQVDTPLDNILEMYRAAGGLS